MVNVTARAKIYHRKFYNITLFFTIFMLLLNVLWFQNVQLTELANSYKILHGDYLNLLKQVETILSTIIEKDIAINELKQQLDNIFKKDITVLKELQDPAIQLANNEMTKFYIEKGLFVIGGLAALGIVLYITGSVFFLGIIQGKSLALIRDWTPFLQSVKQYSNHDIETKTTWIVKIINDKTFIINVKPPTYSNPINISKYIADLTDQIVCGSVTDIVPKIAQIEPSILLTSTEVADRLSKFI